MRGEEEKNTLQHYREKIEMQKYHLCKTTQTWKNVCQDHYFFCKSDFLDKAGTL